MTRRQCEVVRGYLRGVLQRRVFRTDVEPGALVVGPYVQKQGGRTVTLVERLDEPGRVEEIARMLGGESVSDTGRRHAREMLESSKRK